jgi:hypothetical protein
MRKPQVAAFGVRGTVLTTPTVRTPHPKRGWRWPNMDVTVSYGAIVKLAIALWAVTIAVAMLWP